jgi:hypothetical protein
MTGPQIPAAPIPTPPAGEPASPSATTPPTGGGETPPVATEPPGTEAAPPAADEWANFDAERAKQTILNQRKAEAEAKAKLAEANARIAEFERAQLSDAEKLQADLEAAQRERDEALQAAAELTQRQAFDAAAVAAGVLPNALAAARAIAAEVAATDESGTMKVDGTLFDSLKADHGYLFTPQQAAPPRVTFGAASSQGHGGQTAALTPEQVAMAHRAGIAPEDFAKAAGRITR